VCTCDFSDLPLLLPLVLSQVAGGWRISPQFADLLCWPVGQREALARYQPKFEHLLVDLAERSRDELAGNPTVRLAQGLLRAAVEGTLLEWIEWAEPWRTGLPCRETVQVLFRYAVNAVDLESNMGLREFAARIDSGKTPIAAEAFMSIAERIRTEGKAEGKAEGLEEGLEKGREQGLLRGALIGQIEALERLLKRGPTPVNDLNRMESGQLRRVIADLERQFDTRQPS